MLRASARVHAPMMFAAPIFASASPTFARKPDIGDWLPFLCWDVPSFAFGVHSRRTKADRAGECSSSYAATNGTATAPNGP